MARSTIVREIRFGRRTVPHDRALVMAIVNRTKDSFYDRGATFADEPALRRVDQAIAEGADIIDIGGVRAGAKGELVDAAEEARRVVPFVAEVRDRYPDVVISVTPGGTRSPGRWRPRART